MNRILAILCGETAEAVADGEQDSQGPVGELADLGEAMEVSPGSRLNLMARRRVRALAAASSVLLGGSAVQVGFFPAGECAAQP